MNYDSFLIARQMIVDKVSIVDYYMDFIDENIDLSRYNRDCCPLHDESSPSFFYFENTGTFHCFGCAKTGGVTELHYHIQKRLNDNYKKSRAVMDLAKLYEIEIPSLFEEVGFSDLKKIKPKSNKLKFKRPEELMKPRKKTELDLEKEIIRLKPFLDTEVYIGLMNDLDELFFVDGNVNEGLKNIEEQLTGLIKEG